MTIGQTSVKLSTVFEHTVRRLGLPAESQTPEFVQIAKNNLFFILTNLVNRGVNFWLIDEQFVNLTANTPKITTPDGTVDILNANFRNTTTTSGTDSTTATEFIRQFSEATDTVMFRLNSATSATITVSYSTNGVGYTTHSTISHDGTDKWYSLNTKISDVYLKLSVSTGSFSVTELTTVSSYTDMPLFRMNRDDYSALPNKHSTGRPVQYWFDRQLDPVMNVWPAPSSSYEDDCIQFYRKRQISDVGQLNETLDIPNRWLDAIVWQLAKNVGVELPNVQPDRIQLAIQMAEKTLVEAEMEERDNSPVSFSPNISVYTA